jgi:hypothetical protein
MRVQEEGCWRVEHWECKPQFESAGDLTGYRKEEINAKNSLSQADAIWLGCGLTQLSG